MDLLHALLIMLGLERSYSIGAASMQPTLSIGEVYATRNYRLYGRFGPPILTRPPRMGDIIVARGLAEGQPAMKRVIGMPGDTVQMIEGRLYLNGEMVDRREVGTTVDFDSLGTAEDVIEYVETLPNGVEYHIYEISDAGVLDNTEPYLVPTDHYFVMGDNRDRSADSRVPQFMGYVPGERVTGRLEDETVLFRIDN